MRSGLWLWLAAAVAPVVLTACDIDFVAVEESLYATVMLRSDHEAALEASVDVTLPSEEAPARVFLGGSEVEGERESGHWRFQTTLPVDTLDPRVELVIQRGDQLVLLLPLVARNGAAVWQPNGDLEFPVVYGGDRAASRMTWQVVLVDSGGKQLVGINSFSGSLPSPLVLRRELVPAGAVAAEFVVSLHRVVPEAAYPLSIGIAGRVRIPIPDSPLTLPHLSPPAPRATLLCSTLRFPQPQQNGRTVLDWARDDRPAACAGGPRDSRRASRRRGGLTRRQPGQ